LAKPARHDRPVRPLVTLAVLVFGLLGTLLAGIQWSDATLLPHLALDLEGGTEIILEPVADDGEQVTEDTIAQAIDIIRQRVDASGVAEAEITSQGGSNIVVALPGEPDEATLDLVRESAQMLFRPVLYVGGPEAVALDEPTATPDPAVPDAEVTQPEGEEGTDASTDDAADAATDDAAAADAATPADASDPAWLTEDLLAEFAALDCTDPVNLRGGSALVGDPDAAIVACDFEATAKYALGPVEIRGERIASASSGLNTTPSGAITNEWITTISFDGEGTTQFRDVTTRLLDLPSPRNQFAMVLDGLVVSAPQVNDIIPNGQAIISGTFTRESAGTLARQLNFGALPLTFEVLSEQQISATLGSEQLQRGLLAGLIGLVLVGLYSLAQYRALGMVTIVSLAVAGSLALITISVLSWVQGYRLSLPGVAGLIVAIGITADSFIVYFERIRDELRDGRTLVAAVDQGWMRARRTILASDAVSFLAAVVLYFLAVGGVRGFAFTLGLTTVIDLIIVFLFTHSVMRLIARRRFFAEGHPLSGLDPGLLGARSRSRYVGRGRVVGPEPGGGIGAAVPTSAGPAVQVGTERRLTIAERRAAQRSVTPDRTGNQGEDR
jgi:preprotein translocase subunit SecD